MSNQPEDAQSSDPVDIPQAALSAEALRGIVESFVLREGTDYGSKEFSFDEKVLHILRQLERHEAKITYDPTSETVNIVIVQ